MFKKKKGGGTTNEDPIRDLSPLATGQRSRAGSEDGVGERKRRSALPQIISNEETLCDVLPGLISAWVPFRSKEERRRERGSSVERDG